MKTILPTLKTGYGMIARGGAPVLLDRVRRRAYSLDRSYCLSKDLSDPLEIPETQIPISVEPIQERHIDELAREHPDLFPLLEARIPGGHVALTEQGDICFVQWLLTPEVSSSMRQRLVGRPHRLLSADEVLLENAYTVKRFRGLGIMPAVTLQLAEKARRSGARSALTFVQEDNIPALKGFALAGFEPQGIRQIEWRLFRRRMTYEPLSPTIREAFDAATARPDSHEVVSETSDLGADVSSQIERFVRTHFHVDPTDPLFDHDAALFEDGYVDSIGVIELLAFLENELGVDVPEDDLLSDEFSSIRGIAAIVERELSTRAAAASG